ncbi:hypothetical protein DSM100238_1824, partial [Bifidobacterium apri]
TREVFLRVDVGFVALSAPGSGSVTVDGGSGSPLVLSLLVAGVEGWFETPDLTTGTTARGSGDGLHDIPVQDIQYGSRARCGQLHKTDINQKEPLPCQRVNVIALLIRLDCMICALDARSSFARTTFVGMLNVVLLTTVEPNPTLPVTLPPFA